MKKFTVAVFIIVSVFLVVLVGFRGKFEETSNEVVRPKIVVPAAQGKTPEVTSTQQSNGQDIQLMSFVPLLPNETLLNALTADIDGDGFEDQVVLLRRTGSQNLILLTGLYNTASSDYVRSHEIQTGVSQIKSFSFSVSDITGTHANSLIYSGVTDTGETEFKAFLPIKSGANFSMKAIGEFTSDSTIFVQQLQRSDSYFLSQSQGESFPVWVYSTDLSEGADTLDQIQTQYNWNSALGAYVQVSESKMTSKRIAAKELERIQDGTQATFENFLGGLWYKPQTTGSQMRYVFFNPETREIIFLVNDTQEVYLWSNSMLRRSGMYITSLNAEIESLVRRIDIALSASDEIKLKVNDDVAMIIGEENSWDGAYKKMSGKTVLLPASQKKEVIPADVIKFMQTGADPWKMGESAVFSVKNNRYTAITPAAQETGVFSFTTVSGVSLLQFRPSASTKIFDGYYQITVKSEPQPDKSVKETLTLTPANVSASSVFPSGAVPVVLERVQSAEAARAAAILGTK